MRLCVLCNQLVCGTEDSDLQSEKGPRNFPDLRALTFLPAALQGSGRACGSSHTACTRGQKETGQPGTLSAQLSCGASCLKTRYRRTRPGYKMILLGDGNVGDCYSSLGLVCVFKSFPKRTVKENRQPGGGGRNLVGMRHSRHSHGTRRRRSTCQVRRREDTRKPSRQRDRLLWGRGAVRWVEGAGPTWRGPRRSGHLELQVDPGSIRKDEGLRTLTSLGGLGPHPYVLFSRVSGWPEHWWFLEAAQAMLACSQGENRWPGALGPRCLLIPRRPCCKA